MMSFRSISPVATSITSSEDATRAYARVVQAEATLALARASANGASLGQNAKGKELAWNEGVASNVSAAQAADHLATLESEHWPRRVALRCEYNAPRKDYYT